MQVFGDNSTTVVPCKRQASELEYYYKGKEQKYHYLSCNVNLAFALPVPAILETPEGDGPAPPREPLY